MAVLALVAMASSLLHSLFEVLSALCWSKHWAAEQDTGDRVACRRTASFMQHHFGNKYLHLRGNSFELRVKVDTRLSVEVVAALTGDGSLVPSEGEHGKGHYRRDQVSSMVFAQVWMARLPGIGVLIPTCPASMSRWNLVAVAPLLVKTATPLPYLLALIKSTASSNVSTFRHTRTGPKISSV